MIGGNLNTIEALKKHIEEAQYILQVATETGRKLRVYAKPLHSKLAKEICENDKKLACHPQTFIDLVTDAINN